MNSGSCSQISSSCNCPIQLHFVSYQKSLACDSIIMTSDKVYLWCTFAFRLVENYFLKIYSEKWQAFVAIDLLLNVHKVHDISTPENN